MRGTVLLLGNRESWSVFADFLRTNGLLVYETERPEGAPQQIDSIGPDVVLYSCDCENDLAFIRELRTHVDRATSIIVVSDVKVSERAHDAGADSLLLKSASASEILYEVRRALILRRSGRRLPWNQPEKVIQPEA